MPNANEVTVREVLAMFDDEFSKMAEAVANGEFALWIGSGISRKAPNLGDLIDLGVEALRLRALDPATSVRFYPKLEEALRMGDGVLEELRPQYDTPFATWPQHDQIQSKLWGKYSRFLDIRILGESTDFMLWEAVDIRAAFANPADPAAEHLCIAVLVLEGAIHEMASANWDGFIESAMARLSGQDTDVLQVVVDPNQLRVGAGIAKLLKFHGCILHATQEPATFRDYLTGSSTQIVDWPNNGKFSAMLTAVIALATSHRSLVMGLSIQDANLQGVFSTAKRANPWPWPPDPHAQGHVFCEDEIRDGQQDVLKIVYGDSYNDNMEAIVAASHLRAWAEQVLIALALDVVGRKLVALMRKRLHEAGREGSAARLTASLMGLRDFAAELAQVDPADNSRTPFVERAIVAWSRLLAVFRTGDLPANPTKYERVSASGLRQLGADANAAAARLGDFAIALSLLGRGQDDAIWALVARQDEPLTHGAIGAEGNWEGASVRPVFVVKSAAEAIALEKAGAFSDNNAIVIHSDAVWSEMLEQRGESRRISTAPGRTGRVGTTHSSIQRLLERCVDADAIMAGFVAEVSL